MSSTTRMWPRSAWLTRSGVERLLGVTNSKVRRMQQAGELPFVRDERGVCLFPRREIEHMAAMAGRYPGIAAPGPVVAKACALFAQGRTWKEVVILLGELGMGQPIDIVRAIHGQWCEHEAAKRATTPALDEPRKDARDLDEDGDPDIDTWLRAQDVARRRAQEVFEDEERAWDHERRLRRPAGPDGARDHRQPREPAPSPRAAHDAPYALVRALAQRALR